MKRLPLPRERWASRVVMPSSSDVATWLVAFGIAIALWLFVNMGERESERTLRVRLDTEHLPAGMVITSPLPSAIELGVTGSGLILSSIDTTALRTTLDLAGARPGTATYALGGRDFGLPRKVRVTRVSPSHVTVQFDRVSRRSVPVRVQRRGELPEGLKLAGVTIQPDQVVVSGPRERIGPLAEVDTRPIDLSELGPGETEIEAALEIPGALMQLGRPSARLRFVVERVLGERVLKAVPVEARGTGAEGWRTTPSTIELTVRGPQADVTRLTLPADAVWVDVSDVPPGGADLEPQFQVPPGFEVVRWKPRTVRVARLPPATDTVSGASSPTPAPGARPGGKR
jgi:YbbR domain-containing protein